MMKDAASPPSSKIKISEGCDSFKVKKKRSLGSFELPQLFNEFLDKRCSFTSATASAGSSLTNGSKDNSNVGHRMRSSSVNSLQNQDVWDQQQIDNDDFRQLQKQMRQAQVLTNASAALFYEKVQCERSDGTETEEDDDTTKNVPRKRLSSHGNVLPKLRESLLFIMGKFKEDTPTTDQQRQREETAALSSWSPTIHNKSCSEPRIPFNLQLLKTKSESHLLTKRVEHNCISSHVPSACDMQICNKEEEVDHHPQQEQHAATSQRRRMQRRKNLYCKEPPVPPSIVQLSSNTLLSVKRGTQTCDFKKDPSDSKILICDFIKHEETEEDHNHNTRRSSTIGRTKLVRRLSITLKQVETLIHEIDNEESKERKNSGSEEQSNPSATTRKNGGKDLFTLMQEAGAIPCEKDG